MSISFCTVRIEIADEEKPLNHLKFNCGRSLADLLEGLDLKSGVNSASSNYTMDGETKKKKEAARKKARGTRKMTDIVVETYTSPFEATAHGGASQVSRKSSTKSSKESSPGRASVDYESSKESTPASNRSTKDSTPSGATNDNPDQINFISGNPFVEVTKGILHLYKENQTTSLEDGVVRSPMICMLGVPAKLKSPELLQFVAPCHSELEMMRIIHDGSPNQYMVLLRFRCQESADEFYKAFNGLNYNSFEADVCTLVYISKVETCKESEYYPMDGHTELPVCSICLERMDESISTVLTILCNHTFHGSCLAQWEDSTCPVCRYVQTPEVTAEQRCSECQSSDDLWICLVCGYVGCGRYVGGHSHAHFMETQHCYTMELGQNRVWDYVGDNFVHRLVQTDSADGKMVEAEGFGECGKEAKDIDGVHVNSEEKMDSLQLEYTYLLTSQLEAQRRYYEEKITRIEDDARREIDEVMTRARSSIEESKNLESKLGNVNKEKAKYEQRLTALNAKISKLSSELNEERQMNASLRQNQSVWQEKIKSCEGQMKELKETKDKEIKDLQEQMRDLMFYLEAQDKIAKSPLHSEIQEGSIIVGEATPTSSSRGGASRKRRGR